jgi:FkbM family methyltransferase
VLNSAIVGVRTMFGRKNMITANRHGLNWRLDLNEGIDLAVYLGLYQKTPRRVVDTWIRPGSLVLDIGANVGSHTLPFARAVGAGGRVVAIEPTDYAFSKLSANALLNPDLDGRLIRVQAAITDGAEAPKEAMFYSSWPLHGDGAGRHERHLGELQSARGARFVALDVLLAEMRTGGQISGPVKFVKMDVDGHELDVLRGGQQTFTQDRPVVLIELAPHVQDEVPGRFEALMNTLVSLGYRLEDPASGELLPTSVVQLRRAIAREGSIDALAVPVSG